MITITIMIIISVYIYTHVFFIRGNLLKVDSSVKPPTSHHPKRLAQLGSDGCTTGEVTP